MAMISSYKAIGFDMDGTLLNTKIDMRKMAEVIFDEMIRAGVPEDVINRKEGYKFNLDSGTSFLIRTGREDEIYEIYERASCAAKDIEMENVHMARPFPGSLRLISELKRKGYKVGVLTRGCREYAELALRLTGTLDLLDGLVCRDDHPEREAKPSPDAMRHLCDLLNVKTKEILYLGDHKIDYFCARDSGAGFVGVLSGGYSKEDWMNLDPSIEVINTIAELIPEY